MSHHENHDDIVDNKDYLLQVLQNAIDDLKSKELGAEVNYVSVDAGVSTDDHEASYVKISFELVF